MTSLEYLSKYLNKDGAKPKKRKREVTRVVEDDLSGWDVAPVGQGLEDAPQVVEQTSSRRSAGFRPAYQVTEPAAEASQDTAQEPVAAESIVKLSNGARAGLQTKEDIARDRAAHSATQMLDQYDAGSPTAYTKGETVYRDGTGRRVDTMLAKQEKIREQKRQKERDRKELEMNRGLVQQQEKAERQAELEKVRSEGFSRYAGHSEAEMSMKEKQRWNDPASGFLTNKKDSTGQSNTKHESNRPLYTGGYAPNRFGIRPGYRWDGVDRGNGTEAKRFKEMANNKHRRNEYDNWAREDM